MKIHFFGSSLVSAHWNGAATYYRGLLQMLARLGYRVTFYEPDAFGRQANRDIADPDWAEVVVYGGEDRSWQAHFERASREADLIVKASGVGVFDRELELALAAISKRRAKTAFWDVDAPATIERIRTDPGDHMYEALPCYDMVFTYGGGKPVVDAYTALGARRCVPIYNAVDPATHHPVEPEPEFACDLSLLANRLPDREARVRAFFLDAAAALAHRRFLLGGAGWTSDGLPPNVVTLGHVGTARHNAFYCSSLATLNVTRDSMARNGFSPATRVFEAAGAGACLITDAWEGIEAFFEPGKEILVAADCKEVVALLEDLDPERARQLGQAARKRVLAEHTYDQRAAEVHRILGSIVTERAME